MAEDEPPPTLPTLPLDVLACVLAELDPPDLCTCARACKCGLQAAAEEAWKRLDRERPLRSDNKGPFRSRWLEAMLRIEFVDCLGGAEGRPQPQECLSAAAAATPIACGSGPLADGQSLDYATFHRGLASMTGCLHRGLFHAHHQVDWLRTREAGRQPLRCLAILLLLHGWELLMDSGQASGCSAPRNPAAYRRLRGAPWAPSALRRDVVLRWRTWSQARDCRGFRARDDVHTRTASLFELSQQPDHEFWRVLRRGVTAEVRSLEVVCP